MALDAALLKGLDDDEAFSEVSTESGSDDDAPFVRSCASSPDSGSSVERVAQRFMRGEGRVRFADECSHESPIADVIEVESFKDFTRFGVEDRSEAERQWCAELLEQLRSQDKTVRKETFMRMEGAIAQLAKSPHGSVVVQRALDVAKRGSEQEDIVEELHGNVRTLARSPYGSAVLEVCLEVLHPSTASFIVDELRGVAFHAARLEEGHRVLCGIIEQLPSVQAAPLVAELLFRAHDLSYDTWGADVLRHVFDYGTDEQKQFACKQLTPHITHMAADSTARNVVQIVLACRSSAQT
eukprot:TRINITY_DN29192_c0_g1_i1.p1 TRINITY_DN29192_c0_g1~~TRINITY_DN29192_c0_g1_i1.p1  ORF type:complete len:297 (+),score=51.60 TRINITY_DN29192_c0_g1_i1:69-959(+)